jgi:hypothetical protein
MSNLFSQHRRLAAIAAAVALTAVVAAGALVALTTASGSSDPKPASDLPAPVETAPGFGGAVTDSGPNPWMMNDPEWAISFLEQYCPTSPPLTSDMGAEITEAVRDCIASRPAALGDFASSSL